MSQDNASFTFLHRIEEVELNIEDGRWQSALALVLTLPDICGGIAFIRAHDITEFFIAGADATACVKSTCFNMTKVGYTVHVLSDCITSYDKNKLPEMMEYYANKGCTVNKLSEVV